MLENFRTDGESVIAQLQRAGRILEENVDRPQARDIVEKCRIDVDRADPPVGRSQRLGEHAAPDPDLEHPVLDLAVGHRLAKHPVAPRAVQSAPGRVRILVQPPLKFDIALARTDGVMVVHSVSPPTVSRMT